MGLKEGGATNTAATPVAAATVAITGEPPAGMPGACKLHGPASGQLSAIGACAEPTAFPANPACCAQWVDACW
jgi:hypothetical protein